MAVNPPSISFQPVGTTPPGIYCNAVQILFSPWEFNFELAQMAPQATIEATGGQLGQTAEAAVTGVEIHKHVVSRLVMSPQHTKALLKVLQENIDKYEAEIGPIPDIGPSNGGGDRA